MAAFLVSTRSNGWRTAGVVAVLIFAGFTIFREQMDALLEKGWALVNKIFEGY